MKAKSSLDEASCVYGAGLLLKHLQSLSEETMGVHQGSADIEYIHRARVASRRLRAALPLFETCLPRKKARTWLDEIKSVTRALGEARDVDVQIERLVKFFESVNELTCRPGLRRLLLRLTQKRQKLQEPVRKAMEHLAATRVIEDMQAYLEPVEARSSVVYLYTPVLYQHSFNAVLSRLEAFLSYEAIIGQPEKVTELHEMRIAAKWLRYTLETFSSLYSSGLKTQIQAIKAIQELLGDIHDCDVWIEFLPRFISKENQRTLDYFGHIRPMRRLIPGIRAFEQDRRQARDGQYQEFLTLWQKQQEQSVWDQLRQTIQVHFPQPDQIYPPLAAAPSAQASRKEADTTAQAPIASVKITDTSDKTDQSANTDQTAESAV